MSAKIENSR